MATIYVFNNLSGVLEQYTRARTDPMPYNIGGTLTVGEFMGDRPVGWTDLNTMTAWNTLRAYFGRPIVVLQAFETVDSAGCLENPNYYFGQALNIRPLAGISLEALHNAAVESAAFNTVAPFSSLLGHVLVYNIFLPSNYFRTSGLPHLFRNSRNNYVCFLQSALNRYGYGPLAVDGNFGPLTDAAVRKYQQDIFLTSDGIISRLEWGSLLGMSCL